MKACRKRTIHIAALLVSVTKSRYRLQVNEANTTTDVAPSWTGAILPLDVHQFNVAGLKAAESGNGLLHSEAYYTLNEIPE